MCDRCAFVCECLNKDNKNQDLYLVIVSLHQLVTPTYPTPSHTLILNPSLSGELVPSLCFNTILVPLSLPVLSFPIPVLPSLQETHKAWLSRLWSDPRGAPHLFLTSLLNVPGKQPTTLGGSPPGLLWGPSHASSPPRHSAYSQSLNCSCFSGHL